MVKNTYLSVTVMMTTEAWGKDPGSSWCLVSAILRIWGPKFVKSMYLFCGFEDPNFEILSTFMRIWGLIGQRAADNTDARRLHDLAISTELHFTCSLDNYKYHLHTHAPADHILYHLGKNALTGDHPTQKSLTSLAASHWNAFQLTKSVLSKAPPLKIRIPGRSFLHKIYTSLTLY